MRDLKFQTDNGFVPKFCALLYKNVENSVKKILWLKLMNFDGLVCGPCWDRTNDPLIKSPSQSKKGNTLKQITTIKSMSYRFRIVLILCYLLP